MRMRWTAFLLALVLLLGCIGSAFADTVLRIGSRGSDVIALQTALKNLGLYTKTIDGVYGRGTAAAVRAFQARNGLKADGVAGPKTLGKLYGGSSPADAGQPSGGSVPAYATLTVGSRGDAVRTLQAALRNLGLYTKAVDGVYGSGTAAAVLAFQRSSGLPATGIADSATQLLLLTGQAPAAQPPATTPAQPEAPQEQTAQPSSLAGVTRLQMGNSGSAVLALQQGLRALGFYTGELTGRFDAATRSAVVEFQRSKGLTRDGIAGPKTLSALIAAWNDALQNAGLPAGALAFLNALARDSGAVCGTVVLSKNGQPFLTWSFGGVSERTCFRIASVTKWVTAIGLMTLYDRGLLDLDADVSTYLPFKVRNPAFPDVPITARMLLNHTSSLSPDAQNYHPNWKRIGVGGYDPLFNESARPGAVYAYADYNGALFGCLIEAITGESVQNYLNRTVFEPLNLTAAYTPKLLPAGTPTMDLLKANGKVSISVQSDRTRAFNNKADPEGNNGYTVGKLYIDAASLTKLAQMMLGGGQLNGVRILNESTVALMEADQPGLAASKYGLSTVRHGQFPRGIWYGHQGRLDGFSSNVYYQRETGITLALIMDGYAFRLEDNIVLPAVTLLKNMETLEGLCLN
ncbi:MAG: peptidoglycan-binding protein [Clostridia bacterium]|nr:peptidoglycan-binding protein [Clostridia bacterium]